MPTIKFTAKDFGGRPLREAELRFVPSSAGMNLAGDLLSGPAVQARLVEGQVTLEPSSGLISGQYYTLVVVWHSKVPDELDYHVFPRKIRVPTGEGTYTLRELVETSDEDDQGLRNQCLVEVSAGTTHLDGSPRPVEDWMRFWIDTSKSPMVLMAPEGEH